MYELNIPQGAKTLKTNTGSINIPQGAKTLKLTQKEYDEFFGEQNITKEPNIAPPLTYAQKGAQYYKTHEAPPAPTMPPKQEKSFLGSVVDSAKELGEDALGLAKFSLNDGLSDEELKQEGLKQKIAYSNRNIDTRNLTQMFSDDKEIRAKQNEMAYKLAKEAGYDDLGEMNGKLVAVKNGKYVDVSPSFLDTLQGYSNEVFGSVGGAIISNALLKKAKIPAKLAGVALGSALGSGTGSVIDSRIAEQNTGQELDWEDYVRHIGRASADDIVAGSVVPASLKGGKALYDTAGKPLLEGAGYLAKGAYNIAKKTPLAGRLVDNVLTGNVQGAEQVAKEITATSDPEQIFKLYEQNPTFKVDGTTTAADNVASKAEWLLSKAPLISDTVKEKGVNVVNGVIKKLHEIADINQIDTKRDKWLKLAMATEEGSAFIKDILTRNPELKPYVSDIVEILPKRAKAMFNSAGVNENTAREVMQNYQNKTKADFKATIENLDRAYEGTKTTIDTAKVDKLVEDMFIDLGANANQGGLGTILKSLTSGEKSLSQLQALRGQINDKFKNLYKNNQVTNFSDVTLHTRTSELIDSAIDDILKTRPELYDNASSLYKTAKSDYAKMKEASRFDFNKFALNDEKTAAQTGAKLATALNNQGKTFSKFIENLPADEAVKAEVGALNTIFNNALGATENSTMYIQSRKLLENIDNLNFKTQEANEIKGWLKDVAKLTKGHENTAKNLTGVRQLNNSGSFAVSIKGRARQKMVANLWEKLQAYFPVGRQAEQYAFKIHLQKALQSSKTIDDVVKQINIAANKKGIDTVTRASLKEFAKELERSNKQARIKAIEDVVQDRVAKSKEIQGKGFVVKEGEKLDFPDRVKFELGDYLRENLKLNDNPITASLNYLFERHKEMFKSRGEAYRLIKETLDSIPEVVRKQDDGSYYIARSLKQESSNRKSLMSDMVIDELEAENYIKHLNKKPYSKEMREAKKVSVGGESVKSSLFRQPAKTLESQKTNPELKSLSPTNSNIIPQNSSNLQSLEKKKKELLAKTDKTVDEKLRVVELAKLINKESKTQAKVKADELIDKARAINAKKEKRGIYNVAFNEKQSTIIYKDFDAIDEIIKFEKGHENPVTKKGFGAKHIEKHLDATKNGYVTKDEYLNMGKIIRNIEPYESSDGKRVYEYFNNEGVRFRVVVANNKNSERVISFFSNRKGGIDNDSLTYNYSTSSDGIIP